MREELISSLGTHLKFPVKVPLKAFEIISMILLKVINKTYTIIDEHIIYKNSLCLGAQLKFIVKVPLKAFEIISTILLKVISKTYKN